MGSGLKSLLQRAEEKTAPWGISTADFHKEGRLGLKLGAFPTTFLVESFTKEKIIDAIKKGRMYCSRGDSVTWPQLNEFVVMGDDGSTAIMGETLVTSRPPQIRFKVSYKMGEEKPMTVLLIRGGDVIRTFNIGTLAEIEFIDYNAPPGKLTFYRVMDSKKHLTSNPIFVKYEQN